MDIVQALRQFQKAQLETTISDKKPPKKDVVPSRPVGDEELVDMSIHNSKNGQVNGDYLRLKEQKYTLKGPLRNFTYDNQVDPNVQRKRVDPDNAIPTLLSGQYTRFSLPPSTQHEEKQVGTRLVKLANRGYVSFKDRFRIPE